MANPKLSIILSAKDEMTSNIDKARKSLEAIKNSGASARQQLRALQQNLSELNNVGIHSGEVFTEMAQYAGNLQDNIDDARRAISAFADDQFKIKAVGEALSLGTAAGSTFATTLELIGVKNDEVAETLKKAQLAIVALNGVQQVSNFLNKDSALMLRLKQIQLKINAATTNQITAATTANTVATGANTMATAAATVAKNNLNKAVAIGKAIMGDWTGILTLAGGALLGYAMFAGDSADATQKDTDAIKKNKEAREKFNSELASSTAKLVSKYQELRSSYESCRTAAEKTQWIKDNANGFKELGLKIKDVTTADDVFINNTDNVVKALELRAKAAALAALKTQAYEEYYNKMLNADATISGGRTTNFKDEKLASLYRTWEMNKYRSEVTDYVRDGKFTDKGAEDFMAYLKLNGVNLKTKASVTAGDDLNKFLEKIADYEKEVHSDFSKLDVEDYFSKDHDSDSSKSKKNNSKDKKIFDETSIKHAEQMVEEFRTKWQEAPLGMRDSLKAQLEYWEAELKHRKGELKTEVKIDTGSLKDMQNQLNDITRRLTFIDPEQTEEVARLKEEYKGLTEQIKNLQETLGLSGDSSSSSGGGGYDDAIDDLDEMDEAVSKLNESVDQLNSAFTSLGNAIGGTAGEMVSFVSNSIQKIAELIPQISTMVAANEAEAMSGAAAAGASVPFPGNIAAIAAGVATVASIFASLPKFETGGIIGGNSFAGDRLLVRANSGEMILNQQQQSNLFNAINNDNLGGSLSGNVRFVIDGDKLVGVFNNYNNKRRKQS